MNVYIKQGFKSLITDKDYFNLRKAGGIINKFSKKPPFSVVPSELIIELSLFLKYENIFNFMETNKEIYNTLKNSEYLWKVKFYQTFFYGFFYQGFHKRQ